MTRTLWILGALILTAAVLGGLWAAQADDSLIVRTDSERPGVVLRWDRSETRSREFFEGDGVVTELEVASDGRHVALLELDAGKIQGDGYARPPRSTLHVLDRRGRSVHAIEDVWEFAWDPKGDRLVYVSGDHFEGGVGFAPESAHLLEIGGGAARRLDGLGRAYELHWLRTGAEDAVYAKVLGGRAHDIARYDMKSGGVSRPDVPSIHFSPDGLYYLFEPYESIERGLCDPGRSGDTCLRVFERASGREVPDLSSASLGRPLGWLGTDGHELLFASTRGAESRIVDAAAAEVVEVVKDTRFGGALLHQWKAAGGRLPEIDR